MAQQDTSPIKEKIIQMLKDNGPSMPVKIASAVSTSPLFTSAFLSELISEKRILMSSMRVGSSPVYYIAGQEQGLEEYSKFLKGKAREAYDLLKSNKFLVDVDLPPPIRVAMRSIKDFAKPMNEEGVWRYFLIPREVYFSNNAKIDVSKPEIKEETKIIEVEEIKENAEGEEILVKQEIIKEELKEEPTTQEDVVAEGNTSKDETTLEKENLPTEEIEVNIKEEAVKENPNELDIFDDESPKEFADIVREYISNSKIKLIEETDVKKREFLGIGRIETDVGEMELIIAAKNKKNITEKDIEKLFDMVAKDKKMILLISPGEIAKKAKEMFREYKHIIFFKKLE